MLLLDPSIRLDSLNIDLLCKTLKNQGAMAASLPILKPAVKSICLNSCASDKVA